MPKTNNKGYLAYLVGLSNAFGNIFHYSLQAMFNCHRFSCSISSMPFACSHSCSFPLAPHPTTLLSKKIFGTLFPIFATFFRVANFYQPLSVWSYPCANSMAIAMMSTIMEMVRWKMPVRGAFLCEFPILGIIK